MSIIQFMNLIGVYFGFSREKTTIPYQFFDPEASPKRVNRNVLERAVMKLGNAYLNILIFQLAACCMIEKK